MHLIVLKWKVLEVNAVKLALLPLSADHEVLIKIPFRSSFIFVFEIWNCSNTMSFNNVLLDILKCYFTWRWDCLKSMKRNGLKRLPDNTGYSVLGEFKISKQYRCVF